MSELKYHTKVTNATAAQYYLWLKTEKYEPSLWLHTVALHSTLMGSILLSHFYPICNSDSTSVQPSVSIQIPDRPTGRAQVASPSGRE